MRACLYQKMRDMSEFGSGLLLHSPHHDHSKEQETNNRYRSAKKWRHAVGKYDVTKPFVCGVKPKAKHNAKKENADNKS